MAKTFLYADKLFLYREVICGLDTNLFFRYFSQLTSVLIFLQRLAVPQHVFSCGSSLVLVFFSSFPNLFNDRISVASTISCMKKHDKITLILISLIYCIQIISSVSRCSMAAFY